MNWKEHIAIDPRVLRGKPVVRGTRLAVEFVIGLLAQGWTTAQILQEYGQLTSENIRACLAYARDTLILERVYPVPQ